MKKAIAIFTALVLCLVIMVGCGGQTTTSAVSTASSAETESVSSVPDSSEAVSSIAASSEADDERPECDKEFRLELTDGSTYADGETITVTDGLGVKEKGENWIIYSSSIGKDGAYENILESMKGKAEATLKVIVTFSGTREYYEHEYHLVAAE